MNAFKITCCYAFGTGTPWRKHNVLAPTCYLNFNRVSTRGDIRRTHNHLPYPKLFIQARDFGIHRFNVRVLLVDKVFFTGSQKVLNLIPHMTYFNIKITFWSKNWNFHLFENDAFVTLSYKCEKTKPKRKQNSLHIYRKMNKENIVKVWV